MEVESDRGATVYLTSRPRILGVNLCVSILTMEDPNIVLRGGKVVGKTTTQQPTPSGIQSQTDIILSLDKSAGPSRR